MASKTGKPSGKSTGKTPGKTTGKSSRRPGKSKTPAKPKARGPDPVTGATRAMFRAEVLGIGLVLLAVFTLLALLTNSRGQVTGGWVGFLSGLFGVGVWWAPLVLGVLGVWLVVRAVERMPNLPWQRPAGFLLLFIAFIAGAALLVQPGARAATAAQGEGGGQIGALLADGLQGTVGTGGAWALLVLLGLAGVVLLADRLLVDAWYALSDWTQRQGDGAPPPDMPDLRPPVPMPSGTVPWWKRFWPGQAQEDLPRFMPPAGANLVRPEPGAPPAVPVQPPTRTTLTPRPLGSTPGTTSPLGESDLLTPRIVGGAQDWKVPPLAAILGDWDRVTDDDNYIRTQGRLIQETLALFGVPADFEGAYKGPSVTQYLIKPGYVERKIGNETQRVKVKVAKIAALANDLALALAASSVRIEAPIPGTNYVGIEVPNQASNIVGLKELMESESFEDVKGRLRLALGEDVKGTPIITDLTRMPHLLIAGATGSGKSVCINSIVACLLLTNTPDTLRFLMLDPKMVELSIYNGVPHLLNPVVTEIDKAAGVLFWAVKEMERRYTLFHKANARDLVRYNAYLQKNGEMPLPYIVVIVDEMADLMMAAPEEVEKHICRLAQMARAVGIHLIIATQRPSVDVITGLIKANFPARIAFAVTSQIDSRVILDVPGAERLLGRGDMLFMAPDASKLERVQGCLVTDDEINKLVRYWKGIRSLDTAWPDVARSASQGGFPAPGAPDTGRDTVSAGGVPSRSTPSYYDEPLTQPPLFEQIAQLRAQESRDEFFDDAVDLVNESGRCSITLLQRKFRIGYPRAARLLDQLVAAGVVSASAAREDSSDDAPGGPGASDPSPRPPGAPRIVGEDPDADLDAAPPPNVWM